MWKNGKSHGQGTFTFLDGVKYFGNWKDGKPWNVKTYDKDGNIIGKIVKGVKRK